MLKLTPRILLKKRNHSKKQGWFSECGVVKYIHYNTLQFIYFIRDKTVKKFFQFIVDKKHLIALGIFVLVSCGTWSETSGGNMCSISSHKKSSLEQLRFTADIMLEFHFKIDSFPFSSKILLQPTCAFVCVCVSIEPLVTWKPEVLNIPPNTFL